MKTIMSYLRIGSALILMIVCTQVLGSTLSDIHVEGKFLINAKGEKVMLHGVMDTPSPYFSGYRWGRIWQCEDQHVDAAKEYFEKIFTAVTDTAQGSYCNVFRLHLDPCWTNNPKIPRSGKAQGEANISQYDSERLSHYLDLLFVPLAMQAHNHGMYVIMRPPGVCPGEIKVGGEYQKYLLNVWDIVSRNKMIKKNEGWLSLELANEPINVLDANGKRTPEALHDFFQPIVDLIRQNGYKGIIWVPGAVWQQEYRPYAEHPITDKLNKPQIGYAVHWYPGWYKTSDEHHNEDESIATFGESVPVVNTNPIMITEVDWSPENPEREGHYNEGGHWVKPNYGTWATGSTSKFGLAFKATVEYYGNIGMTLTHTHDYLDIDLYLKSGVVKPAFHSVMPDNAYEACSGACFRWYKEWAEIRPLDPRDFIFKHNGRAQ